MRAVQSNSVALDAVVAGTYVNTSSLSSQTVREVIVANDNVVVQLLGAPRIEISFITAPVWVAAETVA